jgi:hypothetical protein
MKLHNPIEVAMNSQNPLLMIILICTVILCGSLFLTVVMHHLGPWFLLAILGIVLGGRILYAVVKGK